MSGAARAGALSVFRIVRSGYPAFDGSGAARWGGRWTSPGRAIIHAAENYALAVLENLVHFNSSELPPHLVVSRFDIPARVSRELVERSSIPEFDIAVDYRACRAIGDRWHAAAMTALLFVPSRLSPYECNVLINPAHRDSAAIRVNDPVPAHLDQRLNALLTRRRREP